MGKRDENQGSQVVTGTFNLRKREVTKRRRQNGREVELETEKETQISATFFWGAVLLLGGGVLILIVQSIFTS